MPLPPGCEEPLPSPLARRRLLHPGGTEAAADTAEIHVVDMRVCGATSSGTATPARTRRLEFDSLGTLISYIINTLRRVTFPHIETSSLPHPRTVVRPGAGLSSRAPAASPPHSSLHHTRSLSTSPAACTLRAASPRRVRRACAPRMLCRAGRPEPSIARAGPCRRPSARIAPPVRRPHRLGRQNHFYRIGVDALPPTG